MAEIGKFNVLTVCKSTPQGMYLQDEEGNEILLPNRYVTEGCKPGVKLKVFIYLDSEDRIIATTKAPKAIIEEFAYLRVKDVNNVGAFLDWGLEKDLFVPFKEQRKPLRAGESCVFFVYIDPETNRLLASSKINKFFYEKIDQLSSDDEVEVLITAKTDLGFTCVVENKYSGLIYENEVFQDIQMGDRLKAYVKKIRHQDAKIDISLQKAGYSRVGDLPSQILKKLKLQAGFMPVNNKTAPEKIYDLFGVSKKTFKMALGALYKERKIIITDEGIKLAPKD
ncbi:MAG: S1-like domain-containing RNA-binding protein [Lentisphaeraceae bacterium]|nr:S1-like domain-containing RNA-binding protein [Lentisphaeraceae bacterium]